MTEITKLYTCECHTEGISVSVDDETMEVFLTGWQMSPGEGKMSLKEKIRWCWYIIRKGKPFNDHNILSFETARSLAFDILKQTAEISEKKAKEKSNGK